MTGFTDSEITEERPRLLECVDASRYVDPSWLDRELRAVFGAEWLMAARLDELPEVGAIERSAGGRSLILTCDEMGVRALHNVCSHRGSEVLATRAESTTLRCPFHGWTYALDGSLVSVPGEQRFVDLDRGRCALRRVACRVWGGIVWVSFAEQPVAFENWLGPWAGELERYRMDQQRTHASRVDAVAANWKACVDAFNETYHVPFIHSGTVGRLVHGRASRFRYAGRHSRMVIPVRRPLVERGAATAAPATPAPGARHEKDLLPEQRRDHVNYTLFPNLILNMLNTWGIILRFEPLAVDRTEIRSWMTVDPGGFERRERMLALQWQEFSKVLDEDLETLERTARGMASPMFRTVRLGGEEERLVHFHRTLQDALSTG